MNEQETYEWIEKYLKGRLTDPERTAFEKRLENDKEFATEVALHRDLQETLSKETPSAFETAATDAAQVYFNEKSTTAEPLAPKKNKRNRTRYFVAASMVVLAAMAGLWLKKSPRDYSEQYARAHQIYPAVQMVRGAHHNEDPLAKGMEAYEKGDYSKAQRLFAKVPPSNEKYITSVFYRALSNHEMDRLGLAELGFLQVIARENSLYRPAAQWYLALSYLKAGNITETRRLCTALSEGSGVYQDDAQQLLKML